jgi:Cyanate lyase C-terminal domain
MMSTINFRLDVRRGPDPVGDRMIVTLDGRFLALSVVRTPARGARSMTIRPITRSSRQIRTSWGCSGSERQAETLG